MDKSLVLPQSAQMLQPVLLVRFQNQVMQIFCGELRTINIGRIAFDMLGIWDTADARIVRWTPVARCYNQWAISPFDTRNIIPDLLQQFREPGIEHQRATPALADKLAAAEVFGKVAHRSPLSLPF